MAQCASGFFVNLAYQAVCARPLQASSSDDGRNILLFSFIENFCCSSGPLVILLQYYFCFVLSSDSTYSSGQTRQGHKREQMRAICCSRNCQRDSPWRTAICASYGHLTLAPLVVLYGGITRVSMVDPQPLLRIYSQFATQIYKLEETR